MQIFFKKFLFQSGFIFKIRFLGVRKGNAHQMMGLFSLSTLYTQRHLRGLCPLLRHALAKQGATAEKHS
jgi:hypothetical protein